MTTALIVVVLLGLGLAIVLWAVRRRPDRNRPVAGPQETDTGWSDPLTPADAPPPPGDPDRRP